MTQPASEESDGQFLRMDASPLLPEILKSICDTYKVTTDISLSI